MSIEKEFDKSVQRQCFESWFKRYLNQPHKLLRDPEIDGDGYAHGDVTTSWHAWCAAVTGWGGECKRQLRDMSSAQTNALTLMQIVTAIVVHIGAKN